MRRARQLWLNIHLWIGVALFLVFSVLGVTGSILVWDQPLERALHSDRFDVAQVKPARPASAFAAAATEAFDGHAAIVSLRLPTRAGEPVTAVGQVSGPPGANGRPRQLTAWLDPQTARVADIAEVARSGFSVIHRLHGSLMIQGMGRKIVGWLGWGMSISCITGLILWWPKGGSPWKGLRWLRTPMVFDNLHHMVGFWICVPLAILSLSGVYISFPQTARALFQLPAQAPRNRVPPAPPLDAPRLGVDEAVSLALEASGGQASGVTWPSEGGKASWRITVARPNGDDEATVRVSDDTGKASAEADGRPRPGPADTLSPFVRKIHDGSNTPFLWQLIIVLAGLAPSVLGVTGLVMWLRKEGRKARLKAEPEPAKV
jgi:uncharacterized iron-regulated membrane protein